MSFSLISLISHISNLRNLLLSKNLKVLCCQVCRWIYGLLVSFICCIEYTYFINSKFIAMRLIQIKLDRGQTPAIAAIAYFRTINQILAWTFQIIWDLWIYPLIVRIIIRICQNWYWIACVSCLFRKFIDYFFYFFFLQIKILQIFLFCFMTVIERDQNFDVSNNWLL